MSSTAPKIDSNIEQRCTHRAPHETKKSIQEVYAIVQDQCREVHKLQSMLDRSNRIIKSLDQTIASLGSQQCNDGPCSSIIAQSRMHIDRLLQIKEDEKKTRYDVGNDFKKAEVELFKLQNENDIDFGIDVGTGVRNKIGAYNILEKRLLLSLDDSTVNTTITYIDLDDFSRYNNNGDHKLGDKVLKVFTTTINKLIGKKYKQKSAICRLGGDEFIIISTLSISEQRIFLKQAQELLNVSTKNISQYPVTFTSGIIDMRDSDLDIAEGLYADSVDTHIENVNNDDDDVSEKREISFEAKNDFVNFLVHGADKICGIGKEQIGKSSAYVFDDIQEYIPT